MESKKNDLIDIRDDKQVILNNEERKILEELNSFSEKNRKEAVKKTVFYNLSLKQILDNFLLTWNDIINEIINLHTKMSKKKKTYWWNNIKQILASIIEITTKGDRLIYVGIMLIIISFFIYFLLISS